MSKSTEQVSSLKKYEMKQNKSKQLRFIEDNEPKQFV